MIEIKGFLETSFLDWPGNSVRYFSLPSCNFRCPYCHNHPLIFHPEQYATVLLEDVLARLHALRNWIDGVCLTGENHSPYGFPSSGSENKKEMDFWSNSIPMVRTL